MRYGAFFQFSIKQMLSHKQQKVKMKSAMLTVVAALVFVALMLTGCTTECEVGGCTYTISSACCDAWKGGESTSDACSNDDDTKAIIEDGLACVGDALR